MIALIRHLPTLDDIAGVYTAADSTVEFAPFVEEKLSRLRQEVALFITENSVKKVFCSPNSRGTGTANELLRGLEPPIDLIADARLTNILQPEWANKSQEVVSQTDIYKLWHADPKSVHFKNGESLNDVKRRIVSLLDDIGDQNALIISHTTPMQVLLCSALRIDTSHIWAFKFDHYMLTVLFNHILLRYNSQSANGLNLAELRL